MAIMWFAFIFCLLLTLDVKRASVADRTREWNSYGGTKFSLDLDKIAVVNGWYSPLAVFSGWIQTITLGILNSQFWFCWWVECSVCARPL